MEVSAQIYGIYLRYVSPEDIQVYTVLHRLTNSPHTFAYFPYDDGHKTRKDEEKESEKSEEKSHRLISVKGVGLMELLSHVFLCDD